jgi:hypothetical protein
MKNNTYLFHKTDLRKNRNHYQYSKYYGLRFIKDYFKARNELLKNYKKKNLFLEKKLIDADKIKTLCRNFEIKKKLYREKVNSREYSLEEYIDSSYQIISYLFLKKNYSILSTLLKMNDLIIYIYNKKKEKKKYLNKLKKIIFVENIIIQRIINEQQVK